MSDVTIELLGLIGFPLGIYLLLDVQRTTKRGWYVQKDFLTVVTEFEKPRLFAINQLIGKFGAIICFAIGFYALWQLAM